MGDIDEYFKQAVRRMSRAPGGKFSLLIGTVKTIDGDTCTVDDYEDVRLNSIIDDLESQFTIYPKVGSKVIIGRLEGEDDAFVIRCSEIDKVHIKIGEQLFEMAEGKFKIKTGSYDLKSILNDTLQQLASAVITTPSGPGNFSPNDITKWNSLKNEVNQLLA